MAKLKSTPQNPRSKELGPLKNYGVSLQTVDPIIKRLNAISTSDTAINGGLPLTAGATTTTTLAASGAATFKKAVVSESGSPATITAAQSGTLFIGTKSSATQTYTLPTTPAAGTFFTFMCGHASGEILINPATGEKIVALVFAAIGADADTAQISNTTTGIKNTAATNVLGDNITLIFDGVDTWFGQGISAGIWASQ